MVLNASGNIASIKEMQIKSQLNKHRIFLNENPFQLILSTTIYQK